MAAACLLFGCCRANEHTLAYQSRVGPVEWLQPYTDDSIRWGWGESMSGVSSEAILLEC